MELDKFGQNNFNQCCGSCGLSKKWYQLKKFFEKQARKQTKFTLKSENWTRDSISVRNQPLSLGGAYLLGKSKARSAYIDGAYMKKTVVFFKE